MYMANSKHPKSKLTSLRWFIWFHMFPMFHAVFASQSLAFASVDSQRHNVHPARDLSCLLTSALAPWLLHAAHHRIGCVFAPWCQICVVYSVYSSAPSFCSTFGWADTPDQVELQLGGRPHGDAAGNMRKHGRISRPLCRHSHPEEKSQDPPWAEQ